MMTEAVAERASRQSQLPKGRTLTQEEQQHLLAELKGIGDERLKLLVPLILFTGIRRTEALALIWRDIDTERLNLSIRWAKYSRIVPISAELLSVAAAHRIWFERTFGSTAPDHYVFPASSDPREQGWYVRREWQRLVRRTGIQCRLYDLRRTCIARLIESGCSDGVAAEISGCSRTVLRYFQHLTKPSC
jgi:integrase